MNTYRSISIILMAFFVFACSTTPKYVTPMDSLKAYTTAVKGKNVAVMKKFLSAGTLQMHQQQAEQQNVPLDEIILRETMVTQDQKSLQVKNQNIEGDRATIEVLNSFGQWETVPFVLEEGIWKIDKQGFANQIRQEIEQQNDQTIDDLINEQRIDPDNVPDASPTPLDPTQNPNATPTPLDPTMTPGVNPVPSPGENPVPSPAEIP